MGRPLATMVGKPFYRQIAVCAVLFWVLLYGTMLLAVTIHEVIGHGLVALALGGHFEGFEIAWDGMGYATAYADDGAPPWHELMVLAGGVAATTMFGVLSLALSRRHAAGSLFRPLYLAISLNCLLDGIPYIFWNSMYPVPAGDIGRILHECGSPVLRWTLVGLSGPAMVAAVFLPNKLLFDTLSARFLTDPQSTVLHATFLATAFIALPNAFGWLLFDWNQLAPGIGLLPNLIGILLSLLVAAWLLVRHGACSARRTRTESTVPAHRNSPVG